LFKKLFKKKYDESIARIFADNFVYTNDDILDVVIYYYLILISHDTIDSKNALYVAITFSTITNLFSLDVSSTDSIYEYALSSDLSSDLSNASKLLNAFNIPTQLQTYIERNRGYIYFNVINKYSVQADNSHDNDDNIWLLLYNIPHIGTYTYSNEVNNCMVELNKLHKESKTTDVPDPSRDESKTESLINLRDELTQLIQETNNAYTAQYTLSQKLKNTKEEKEKVINAARVAVETTNASFKAAYENRAEQKKAYEKAEQKRILYENNDKLNHELNDELTSLQAKITSAETESKSAFSMLKKAISTQKKVTKNEQDKVSAATSKLQEAYNNYLTINQRLKTKKEQVKQQEKEIETEEKEIETEEKEIETEEKEIETNKTTLKTTEKERILTGPDIASSKDDTPSKLLEKKLIKLLSPSKSKKEAVLSSRIEEYTINLRNENLLQRETDTDVDEYRGDLPKTHLKIIKCIMKNKNIPIDTYTSSDTMLNDDSISVKQSIFRDIQRQVDDILAKVLSRLRIFRDNLDTPITLILPTVIGNYTINNTGTVILNEIYKHIITSKSISASIVYNCICSHMYNNPFNPDELQKDINKLHVTLPMASNNVSRLYVGNTKLSIQFWNSKDLTHYNEINNIKCMFPIFNKQGTEVCILIGPLKDYVQFLTKKMVRLSDTNNPEYIYLYNALITIQILLHEGTFNRFYINNELCRRLNNLCTKYDTNKYHLILPCNPLCNTSYGNSHVTLSPVNIHILEDDVNNTVWEKDPTKMDDYKKTMDKIDLNVDEYS